jgi:hypothetical protein
MIHVRAIAAIFFAVVSCAALADAAKDIAQKYYKDLEAEARKDWEQGLEFIQKERDRRAKAGEQPLSADVQRDGIEGIKSMLYNRSVIHAVCAEEAARNARGSIEEAKAYLGRCVDERLSEFRKFTKISEYEATIGMRKSALCEMKSRDYKNELRFAPYDFLRVDSGKGPYLLDFKTFNDCILSGPD